VTSLDKGAGAVGVVRQVLEDDQAIVDWPGATRSRAVQLSRLQVRPLHQDEPAVPPTAAGQPVLGMHGKHHMQLGTVTAMHGVQ
jgi:hypothetical protein